MERNTIIRDRFQAGEAAKEIATDLGVSLSTIYAALRSDSPRKGGRAAYETLHVRVTPAEFNAFERAISKYRERSRSSFLRRLIRMAADMPTATPDEEAYLSGLEVDLRALSGNFNQIARDLSASVLKTGEANPRQDQINAMNDAQDKVEEIRAAIARVFRNSQLRNERHIALMGGISEDEEGIDG